jgi:hypothetical protein
VAPGESDKLRAAYNRASYVPERRRRMQGGADHLDALRAGANVVPLWRPAVSA